MNSNRLHNIFGKKSRLSRDEITEYGHTKDPKVKHRIEEQASDAFEQDALDGWEELSYDTSAMKRLDKKFAPTSNLGYIFGSIGALAIVTGILLYIYIPQTTETTSNHPISSEVMQKSSEPIEVRIESTDILLPETIEDMVEAPQKQQVIVESIQHDFQDKKETIDLETPISLEVLPFVDAGGTEESFKSNRSPIYGSEIYLHDLKLVDYSKYRSKSVVHTKQVKLTGTPANMEGEFSETEDPIWQDIDVPYTTYINKSIATFSKGNYKRALARFETIKETYANDANANFYGGVCLYNLGQYQQAIDSFKNCLTSPYSNFDEESQWMIALSYEKLGNNTLARKYFKKIVDQGGFYKTRAAQKMK